MKWLERTNLAGADLVKGDKGKSLGEHGGREVGLGHGEGNEDAGEGELREEGEGLDLQGCGGWRGGGEVELGVVGAEVVAVVDAGYVVEVGVVQEGGAVAVGGLDGFVWEERGAYRANMARLRVKKVARLVAASWSRAGVTKARSRLNHLVSVGDFLVSRVGAPPIRSSSIHHTMAGA